MVDSAWVPGGTYAWLLPEGSRGQTLPVAGEKVLAAYVLRRASTPGLSLSPAGHHISNSKGSNVTVPKRL